MRKTCLRKFQKSNFGAVQTASAEKPRGDGEAARPTKISVRNLNFYYGTAAGFV